MHWQRDIAEVYGRERARSCFYCYIWCISEESCVSWASEFVCITWVVEHISLRESVDLICGGGLITYVRFIDNYLSWRRQCHSRFSEESTTSNWWFCERQLRACYSKFTLLAICQFTNICSTRNLLRAHDSVSALLSFSYIAYFTENSEGQEAPKLNKWVVWSCKEETLHIWQWELC